MMPVCCSTPTLAGNTAGVNVQSRGGLPQHVAMSV